MVPDVTPCVSATHNISVVDATGTPVDLSTATDLVAGRHPARVHPQGPSPYTVMYASASAGDIWAVSPISGSSTWNAYKVATGLGPVSLLAFDNCATGPADSARDVGSYCVYAATASGVVPVPLTDTNAVSVETPWAPRAPASAVGVASNTVAGDSSSDPGAFWSTDTNKVSRTNWDGSVNTVSQSGTAMTAPAGITWMGDNFYVADSGSRKLFSMTPSGVRTVVAGSGTTIALDGAGTSASFVNPTRVHWHGTPNLVYVLDGPCVRRVVTNTGEVTTLACPATTMTNPLTRIDTATGEVVLGGGPDSSTTWSGSFEFTEDGNKAVFASNRTDVDPVDTASDADVYIKDFITNETTLITTEASGPGSSGSKPSMSDDATKVAYRSGEYVYHHDVTKGVVTQAAYKYWTSQMDFNDLSPDGTTVLFEEAVSTDNARRRQVEWFNGSTTVVSPQRCFSGRYSGDGTKIIMRCSATLFVGTDTNGSAYDLVVKDRTSGSYQYVSTTSDGNQVATSVSNGVVNYDGTKAYFTSTAPDLVPGDTNGNADLFEKNLTTGELRRIGHPNGTQFTRGVNASIPLDISAEGLVSFVTSEYINQSYIDNSYYNVYVYYPNGALQWVSATHQNKPGGWHASPPSFSSLEIAGNRVGYVVRYPTNADRRILVTRLFQ